jgi:alpha-L-fucosidase
MNTFMGNEWGDGSEDPKMFNPTELDCRQWIKFLKKNGFGSVVLTTKHHDGFCLWPSKYTEHSVKNSSYKDGTGDIVREFTDACREYGMKAGVYLSPWDRNCALYGTPEYNDYYCNQLTELLTGYGDIFCVWFDGACGEGPNGKKQVYDWQRYYDVIRERQPKAVISICGPDVRWIGNEAGWAGQTNWSTENRDYAPERNGMYGTEDGWFWLPGESDAKATNRGWFWHDGEAPHSPERLFQMYLETVGRNSTLILNLPPNQAGVLPEATVNSLVETGNLIKQRLGKDLAAKARVSTNYVRKAGKKRHYKATNMTDNKKDTYWATNDGQLSDVITLTWKKPQTVRYVELMEYIAKGQRIRKFHIETSPDGVTWTRRADNVETTTVGYKRIIPLNGSTQASYDDGFKVKALRIVIEDSKACPLISKVAVY